MSKGNADVAYGAGGGQQSFELAQGMFGPQRNVGDPAASAFPTEVIRTTASASAISNSFIFPSS